jgi:hypothetical protein
MSKTNKVGDLEINQDMAFQERFWQVQRVGRVIMILLVIGAILGVLGWPGPLSSDTASDAQELLQVQYERFGHWETPMELQAQVKPEAATGGQLQLWLDREYADRANIEKVIPGPKEVATTGEWLIYTFNAPEPDQPLQITFEVNPSKFGAMRGRMGLDQNNFASFNQLIYP